MIRVFAVILWAGILWAALLGGSLGPFQGAAWAVEPDEILDDPVLEGRARALSAEIRCLVCQNESIESSNAELARELRILVRERLVAGDSDEAVKAYLVRQYGDFVLLRPPMKPGTYLLWFGPLVLLVLVLPLIVIFLRRQGTRRGTAGILSSEERERLDAILGSAEGEREAGEDATR